ncbi:MAG: 4-alpha-glucanotransferase [Balneolaceae bacterium]
MRFPRSCGSLVHPTSFPSPYGLGDLGYEAETFIDFLADTGQSIWQVLPLAPVGHGNSPYASFSAFAGNPYLISPDKLVGKGLITQQEAAEARLPLTTSIEFDEVFRVKKDLLVKAADRFFENPDPELEKFQAENDNWLPDYVLFRVHSIEENFRPWNEWEEGWVKRKKSVLKNARQSHKKEIQRQIWMQYEFHNQWADLRDYAHSKNVRVIGDIPIFVSHNSADVWANPQYFEIDEQGNRQFVAGVPPDYFSETGQLWGNPLYKWDKLEKDGFSWWIDRFNKMFELFDAIRVDHFRGFESCWKVSAKEKTAEKGSWEKIPGENLFKRIQKELGEVPIIAEDLGLITADVEKLRDQFNFPGMKILQFAFGSDYGNAFLPHNYHPNSVVYSGTHDNDTTLGWYHTSPEAEKHRMREYTRSDGAEPNWEFIRLGLLSVADQAIFPLQDFMGLASDSRMNTPGTVGENWDWRYTPDMLENIDRNRIRHLITMSNRLPVSKS